MTTKKKLLIWSLVLFNTLNVTAQTYSGGNGTEFDPYLISSKADMEVLATWVNASSSYSTGKYFLLTQDITDAVTTIIGKDDTYCFKGTFDGGGHKVIANINRSGTASAGFFFVGIFGYTSNATIKNLGISGSINRTTIDDSASAIAGGICAIASNTNIINCFNLATIEATTGIFSAYAGGICGEASGSTIINCYNIGNISATRRSTSIQGSNRAGGICGFSSNGSISNCLAANTSITAKNRESNSEYIGRILGYSSSGTIENCYAWANMTLNSSTLNSQDATNINGKDLVSKLIMSNSFTCSNMPTTIFLFITNAVKWQRSSSNGNEWIDIPCTIGYYTETNPSAGHYIYRAQNGDGTYSPYVEVTYHDAVPATINTLPLTGATKTVDESITFSLELQDDNYNYQWYKNNTVIENATSNTLAIDVIKSINAGVYKCKVWNGCNEIYSETSTLTVNKCPQVITFPEIPIKTYGDEAITLLEKTDKGLVINYQSTNTNVATISGNILTLKTPGTSTIIATQGGNNDYLLAPTVERTLTLNKQTQTITFGEIATKRYGDPAFNLPATTDKGLTISYQVINTNVATVVGNTVTIHNSGTTEIIASQAGNDYYYPAVSVNQILTVQKANQSITFADFEAQTYGDPDIELNQYSDAGLEITYTSDNEEVATINGNTIVLHNAGNAQITATQNGNNNYNPAPPIIRTLIIGKARQTIVWDNIPPKTYGDEDFYLPVSTDKGLNIAYSVASENVATVTGNKVHIVGAGTTNITASQVGNSNYFPASSVTLTLTVSKALQTITFNELTDKTYGDPAFELQANVNSNLPVTFESSNTNTATILGNILTIVNAGTTYITASVAGNDNYYMASPVQQPLTVNKATQTIALDIIPDKTYGDVSFALNVQVNTGLPVTYISSDPSKLFISGNQATIFGAGSFTVTATQSGNNNYLLVSDNKTFVVNKANLTVSAENKERYYGDENPLLTYTFSGFVNGDSKIDLQTPPTIICTAEQTSPVGNYPINVSGANDNNYNFAYQNAQLTVNKALLTVKPNSVSRKYGENNPAFVLAYSGFKNGETESILPEKPMAVTNAKATSDVGVYDIFVSGGSANNYDFVYFAGNLQIEKALLTITAENKSRKQGEDNPLFTLLYSGFKNDENELVLDELPVISCEANKNSPAGFYDIVLSGGSDNNYEFSLVNGKLEITATNSIDEISAQNIFIYPNPANQHLYISSDVLIKKIELHDSMSSLMLIETNKTDKIDVSALNAGLYIVKIYTENKAISYKVIVKH
jgi:hypothetical protein